MWPSPLRTTGLGGEVFRAVGSVHGTLGRSYLFQNGLSMYILYLSVLTLMPVQCSLSNGGPGQHKAEGKVSVLLLVSANLSITQTWPALPRFGRNREKD